MAHTASARKRIRQSEKRCERNTALKSAMKTSIKKVLKAVEGKDTANVQPLLSAAIKTISKTCSKGVIHKNNAARRVSRLQTIVNKHISSN